MEHGRKFIEMLKKLRGLNMKSMIEMKENLRELGNPCAYTSLILEKEHGLF